ncbi:hypothetical protein ACWOC1_05615 [Enterococcus quebecensis]|uniref:Uncharacterized protein n=1 Tax=Enterococcus quebecensis TaxID=903983 RepID=A0A1E5GU74_9ENTE|nr:hypothetical protein [Enterococcus quebecensis]OEG16219.1 hypothetical protein BCR23_04845 [Enterococcus quebecensis]OJG74510.1 hypothetical protein RV12_GL002567 [Enterococcus quebecensis]
MDFKKIKEEYSGTNPEEFLTTVLKTEQGNDDAIIFSQTLEEQFEVNVDCLATDETITLEDISRWKEDSFLVVAQTIDGDYIAGTPNQTFVIPVSLFKIDIETYDLFLSDFFIEYINGALNSSILPQITK